LIKQVSAINTSDTRAFVGEQWLAFRSALQFLSWIPAGQLPFPDPKIMGKSVAWYPLIGLLLGLILGLTAIIATNLFNDWISAALLLTIWVWLTGALHLDGLADSADAWLGGLGSRTRTLKLMKDPTSGPIAIATVMLVLFLKLACIQALLASNNHWTILWALVFARSNAVLLLIHTPYVRAQGLGNALSEQLSTKVCYLVITSLSILSLIALGWSSFVVITFSGLSLFALRYFMLKRLDGCTGDTLGALIELSETAILLSLVACLISP
jgi:adenosylcobinamide-GDP ribazoletransferase